MLKLSLQFGIFIYENKSSRKLQYPSIFLSLAGPNSIEYFRLFWQFDYNDQKSIFVIFSPFVLPFNEAEAIIAAIIIYPLFIFGVIGNTLTIITVARSSKLSK